MDLIRFPMILHAPPMCFMIPDMISNDLYDFRYDFLWLRMPLLCVFMFFDMIFSRFAWFPIRFPMILHAHPNVFSWVSIWVFNRFTWFWYDFLWCCMLHLCVSMISIWFSLDLHYFRYGFLWFRMPLLCVSMIFDMIYSTLAWFSIRLPMILHAPPVCFHDFQYDFQ